MTRIYKAKTNHLMVINQLGTQFQAGNVLTSDWLSKHDISAKLAWWYVHSGWLERIGHQIYKKAGSEVNWGSAINALQSQLKLPVHIGGKTALEIFGKAHYVPIEGIRQVTIFSETKANIPKWVFNKDIWNVVFKLYRPALFSDDCMAITESIINDNKVLVSTPELAIFEILYLVPTVESFDEANLLMEGLKYLRPNIIQILLENCRVIKVKRLLLYLADKFNHEWLNELKLDNIDLGSGKLTIGGGGNYSAKYKLSVPILRNE